MNVHLTSKFKGDEIDIGKSYQLDPFTNIKLEQLNIPTLEQIQLAIQTKQVYGCDVKD